MATSRKASTAGTSSRSSRSSKNATGSRGPRPLAGTALLETLIGGWRPLARLDVDGFAMLRSRGITRRANSAVALDAPTDPAALEPAVTRLEGLYEAAGAPSVFRIVEGHGPEQLDAHLDERGYLVEGRSEIHELVLDGAKLPAPHPQARISTGALDEGWFTHAWRLAPREGEDARRTVRDIMAGTPAVHVALPAGPREDDDIVAVGRAALVETGRSATAVLNAIAVDPAHRRQGLGTAVVGSLLTLAAAQGHSAPCSRSRRTMRQRACTAAWGCAASPPTTTGSAPDRSTERAPDHGAPVWPVPGDARCQQSSDRPRMLPCQ